MSLVFFTACQKDPLSYEGGARLQFGPLPEFVYNTNMELADTLKTYTFFYNFTDSPVDTVYFDLYAIGGPHQEARAFELEQVILPKEENAEAGTHYVPFDDPSVKLLYTFPAETVHVRVPIIMKRDPSLKEKKVKLHFRIKRNANFEWGEERLSWRRVEFSDMVDRPAAWDTFNERFFWGTYSRAKHTFMVQYTGQLWDQEFLLDLEKDNGLKNFWKARLKGLLADYNIANPNKPIIDENTKLAIKFP